MPALLSPGCTRLSQTVQSIPSPWMELPVQSSSCNLRVRGNGCTVLDSLQAQRMGCHRPVSPDGKWQRPRAAECTSPECCHSHPHPTSPLENLILPPKPLQSCLQAQLTKTNNPTSPKGPAGPPKPEEPEAALQLELVQPLFLA